MSQTPQFPQPLTVPSVPVTQADFMEKEMIEGRESETESFQQQQTFQQPPLPPPQQIPPPPQQLPTMQYQGVISTVNQWGPPNQWQYGPPHFQNPPAPTNVQYSHIPAPWQQPVPQFLDPRESIDLKLVRKAKKKDKRCYTCKPRGKVKKHMINTSSSGLFTFHHDMHKRPVIIVTPVSHIEQVSELSPEHLNDMFKSIDEFTELWNIKDYQVSINVGKWQDENHSHFSCKIRIPEKMANRLRRDHFQRIKLEKRYEEVSNEVIGPKS